MTNKPTNIAASIRAKLLNVANQSKLAFDVVVLQYFQERFLYRLAQSKHRSKLILKGALMFRAYGIPITRPTKDIDFLGRTIGPEKDLLTTIQFVETLIILEHFLSIALLPETITARWFFTTKEWR